VNNVVAERVVERVTKCVVERIARVPKFWDQALSFTVHVHLISTLFLSPFT
jgi:hypothetical protein